MGFSGTVLKQREKELKALKTFLMCSMIGSLTLHIVLLASGIGNIFAKVPEIDEEPIEIAFIDSPPEPEPEPEPSPVEKQEPTPVVKENSQTITNTNRDADTRNFRVNQQKPTSQPVVTPKQPTPKVAKLIQSQVQPLPTKQSFNSTTNNKVAPTPKQPVKNNTATPPQNSTNLRESLAKVRDTRNTQNSSQTTTSQISKSSVATQTQNSTSVTSNISTSPPSNEKLRGVLQGIRDSRNLSGDPNNSQTQKPASSPGISKNTSNIAIGTNKPSSKANNNSRSNTNSNNRQTTQPKVATAPTKPKIGTNNSNNNGRAACRKCNVNYPEWARRRKVEGKVEVAVDTDKKGNVTNVRLVHSSGSEKLDREHLRRAQKWKLKPNNDGRRGVKISTEYAIRGSRRYRKLQQRKKRQEAQARNRSTNNTTSNSNTQNSRRRRRLITSTSENIPTTSTRQVSTPKIRRRRKITGSSSNRRRRATNSASSSTRRLRKRLTNSSSSSTRRVRKRRQINQVSASQRRLRNRLRRRKTTNRAVNSRRNSRSSRRRRRILPKPAASSSSSKKNRLRNILLRHKKKSSGNNQ